jgi:hypothetical protein
MIEPWGRAYIIRAKATVELRSELGDAPPSLSIVHQSDLIAIVVEGDSDAPQLFAEGQDITFTGQVGYEPR